MRGCRVKGKDLSRYLLLTLICIVLLAAASFIATRNAMLFKSQTGYAMSTYLVKVTKVIDVSTIESPYAGTLSSSMTDILFEGEVLYGEKKGETLQALQSFDGMISHGNYGVEEGDMIFVSDVGQGTCISGNYFRLKWIAVLFAVVVAFLILFAGLKGVATTLALGFTVASVFLVFVPAILSGYNVYLWTVFICLFSVVITPLYVGGFNRKALSSMFGSISGIALAAVLSLFMNSLMKITGFASEEDMYVVALLGEPIDMRAIVFAATLIGALGSTLDVSMSVATSVWELAREDRSAGFGKLLSAGFHIGRDILGTQVSTLILAYIGSSLSTVLLLFAYQSSVLDLLNLEVVILQLLDMLIGASTILLTIPFTALISALMFRAESGSETPGEADEGAGGKAIFRA